MPTSENCFVRFHTLAYMKREERQDGKNEIKGSGIMDHKLHFLQSDAI